MKYRVGRSWCDLFRFLHGQRGSGVIDYIAIGLLALGLVGAIVAGLEGNSAGLGKAVADAISRIIAKIQ